MDLGWLIAGDLLRSGVGDGDEGLIEPALAGSETLAEAVGRAPELEQVAAVGEPVEERRGQPLQSKLKFYPVLVDVEHAVILDAGEPLPMSQHPSDYDPPHGVTAVWPIREDGSEGRWQLNRSSFKTLLEARHVKIGNISRRTGKVTLLYLPTGLRQQLSTGAVLVVGHDKYGGLEVEYADRELVTARPKTQWNAKSHSATDYGTSLLRQVIPGRKFPFPKSLYAVEDTIRFFVKDKPNAVVLDFFAGSGTTAHAVMRLNRQDGGNRQSIMITNNEVSVDEAADLRRRRFRPGDPEWEALGIFEHITRPRVEAAVTGKTPDGEPIRGDYKFTDEFPMAEGFAENVNFLELTYLGGDDVDLGFAFDDLAAQLWLRAGAKGPIAHATDEGRNPVPYFWTDYYGVIFDTDQWRGFVSKRPESAQAAFIVTYSSAVFASIAAELPAGIDVVRLYDAYLSRFLPERAGV